MALNLSTPGVYVQEPPASSHPMVGVATSVPAFVGVTASGPDTTPVPVHSWDEYQQQFGGLAWNAMVSWAVYGFFAEGGSRCYVVRAPDLAQASAAHMWTGPLAVHAITPGAWGNALCVCVSDAAAQPPDGSEGASPAFSFNVLMDPTLPAPPGGPVARLQSLVQGNSLPSMVVDGKSWVVLEQFSGFTAASLQNGELTSRVNNLSILVRLAVAPLNQPQRPANTGALPLSGGTEPRLDVPTALRALDLVTELSLLALPDSVSATAPDGTVSLAAQAAQIQAGLQYCEARTSLFMVADPPAGLDVNSVIAFKTGTGTAPEGNAAPLVSSYGAIYYPWAFVFNAATASNVPMPPSGLVLGRYAGTDQAVGVFQAPAGVHNGALPSVTELALRLTDSDQDQLNPLGIDCLRSFPLYGNVIWGARTLSADPEWLYVNVRRLLIYVEQSVKVGLSWVVFAPNTHSTQALVTAQVTQFLTALWQAGGLIGSSASQAFHVTCDQSNNPPEVQAQGMLYVTLSLAVTHPAEFVVLQIEQQAAQSS
ncbi:MAG: phage tail sheath family protein [Ramlibacter sp.]|nr:phage tail sheath family protein [Ramlibacter sp.]